MAYNTCCQSNENVKLQDQEEIVQHTFQCGMKLEAVNPNSRNQICPATVVEVIDSRYFVVEIDDLQETDAAKRIHFCGHSRTPTIFPIQWTIYKGIKLTPPPGQYFVASSDKMKKNLA